MQITENTRIIRSAKPVFMGSTPIRCSNKINSDVGHEILEGSLRELFQESATLKRLAETSLNREFPYTALPESLQRVEIRNLKVGTVYLDLAFEKYSESVAVNILRRTGCVGDTLSKMRPFVRFIDGSCKAANFI
jgi:hypothetical protein